MRDVPSEPTSEQCSANAFIEDCGAYGKRYATWYPQMGGYVGRCIVEVGPEGCFGVYVWHDGTFPFDGGRRPARLHHCDPQQFIEFGEFVESMMEER